MDMPETSHHIKRATTSIAPTIFPQIPSLPHRLPLPHRRHLALLHCLHRTVSLSPAASSSSPSSPPSVRWPTLVATPAQRPRCGGAAGSGRGDHGCRRHPRRCGETLNRCGCGEGGGVLRLSAAEGDGVERHSPSRCPRYAACRGGAGICTCLACRVSSIVIYIVVQMVRVVGLTDGPGFFCMGWGDGGFWTRVCWINWLQKC